jgi:hypothetical protein
MKDLGTPFVLYEQTRLDHDAGTPCRIAPQSTPSKNALGQILQWTHTIPWTINIMQHSFSCRKYGRVCG